MHPYLMEQLAREHQQEMIRSARRTHQRTQPERRTNRRWVRQRAGFALIKLGHRLAAYPNA
jgi:hypothetical protein